MMREAEADSSRKPAGCAASINQRHGAGATERSGGRSKPGKAAPASLRGSLYPRTGELRDERGVDLLNLVPWLLRQCKDPL